MTVVDEPAVLFHLHLSDSTPVSEEELTLDDGSKVKVLWKDVLVEGEYPMSPSSAGATSEPMRVVAQGQSDAKTKTISMSDLMESHEDSAFKYVTVPTSHRDGVLDNTGYVPRPGGLRIVEKKSKKVMQAALGFTEPDVKGKVERGTIPDVSAGIFFNWQNKHTKKRYRSAMKHVALTPVPFMGNLDPFPAVFASDDEIAEGTKVEVYNFDTTPPDDTQPSSSKTGEIVWNEKSGYGFISGQINAALNPDRNDIEDGRPFVPRPSYYVRDVSTENTALVEEFFKGEQTKFVIPFTKNENGEVAVSPATRWVEVREAMIAASDKPDFEELSASKLHDKLSVALGEQLGTTDSVYRVEDVSLDHRARVTNKAMGKSWIAHFAVMDNGSVWLEPADQWEPIKASDKPKDDAMRPATSTSKDVVNLDDTPEARLRVARQKRRAAMGRSSQSQ